MAETATNYVWDYKQKKAVQKPVSAFNTALNMISNTSAGAGRTSLAPLYSAFHSDEGVARYLNTKESGTGAPDAPNNPNGGKDSPPGGTTVPAPTYMTREEAEKSAHGIVDPAFAIQLSEQEQDYSKQREETPQYMAARRGGLSGLRGGMFESAMNTVTQKENAAKDKLKAQQLQVLSSTASDFMNSTNSMALAKWQAETSAAQTADALAYQKWRDKVTDANSSEESAFNKALTLANLDRLLSQDKQTQENWEKTYGLEAGTLQNSPEYRQLVIEGMGLDNATKALNLNTKYSRNGGGTGGRTVSSDGSALSTKASKDVADAIINDMQNEKLYLINNGGNPADFSKYMAQSITEAQGKGVWDSISNTDKARIFSLINNTTNYDNSKEEKDDITKYLS